MIQYGIKNMCRMIAILGKFPVNIKIHLYFTKEMKNVEKV